MSEQQIRNFAVLVKENQSFKKEELLQAYRSAGFNANEVRQSLNPKRADSNKFLVSYDLMPDGTVANYTETPIE